MRRMAAQDIPELKALWKKVFGDTDEYIDLFFEDLHHPDGGVVIHDNGTLAAMGFLVRLGEYNGREALVTYAVACEPDFRGRGHGAAISRELMSIAGEGAVICPAEKSLFDFYRDRAGYETAFYVSEYTFNNSNLISGVGSISSVTAAEYAELREKRLLGIPHIVFDQKAIRHQERISALTGGGLFRVCDGCCAVELWGGRIIVKELLASNVEKSAATIKNHFGGNEITVRCPVQNLNNCRPFAMAKQRYNGALPYPWFGFAFD
ncbi:MAG: GNAT family N-acetyltransferase [Ruminococcaceae bacterium]|nr:GNAT family N-acetyltransferase [Oscillospiraceae bacterium]